MATDKSTNEQYSRRRPKTFQGWKTCKKIKDYQRASHVQFAGNGKIPMNIFMGTDQIDHIAANATERKKQRIQRGEQRPRANTGKPYGQAGNILHVATAINKEGKMKSDFKFNLLILLIILAFAANSGATENVDSSKPVEVAIQQPTRFDFSSSPFTEVVLAEGVTADELYYRAREWFSRAFRSANNVLQMDSKEKMLFIGKGAIEIPPGSTFGPSKDATGYVRFTMSIYLKDGRYKYEVAVAKHETSFSKNIVSAGSLYKSEADGGSVWSGKLSNGTFEYIKKYAANELGLLVDSLKNDMAQSAKNDDW